MTTQTVAPQAGVQAAEEYFGEVPANIAVVGVGGGGCNAVIRMMRERSVPGVKYVCVNTDIKSLERSKQSGATVVQIGARFTRGMGAGGDPDVGSRSAEMERLALKRALGDPDLVFITAGMGGGTGTGAAPVVAEVAKSTHALVVGLVTTPFAWEGSRRLDMALSGASRLKEKVDNLIIIHNDRLIDLLGKDISMEEALIRADEAVMYGLLSVAELVNVPGEINVDLADVNSMMKIPGLALMAIGEASAPNGALEAAKKAVSNPLLHISIDGAKGILFCVNGGSKLTLGDVNDAGEHIAARVDQRAAIFFGMVNDERMADRVRVTVIATGIPDARLDAATTAPAQGQTAPAAPSAPHAAFL
ncbi:MAG: cell division protein FtsZ [SAR202 cluster bacterium]|nr:cell division protein FtsZ [SAR202 cluster bacterium]